MGVDSGAPIGVRREDRGILPRNTRQRKCDYVDISHRPLGGNVSPGR